MNEDISIDCIKDRLVFHAKTRDNLTDDEFTMIFPELSYYERKPTSETFIVDNWFVIEPESIWQVSAYSTSLGDVYLLVEKIWMVIHA